MINIKPLCGALAAIAMLVAAHVARADEIATQTSADEPRARVGLVLGGGGARGAAHIGVLKELERRRIPIDVIAGTSMGAIVGGLYATGMSADELEQLVASLDWVGALSDEPHREDLSFRRKQDDRQFPIDFELGVRGTELIMPQGVIQGHKLDLLLRELTLSASHVHDFDKLPIPFRAIASDIERGEIHVMKSGDLALAIRASMSVPGAFAPVRIDDHLLVDGGLVGNLPVDIMQSLGVDVIIAVDVEFPLYGPDELGSAVAISEQMLTILIRKETLRQIDRLGDHDVLIRPDLGVYPSTDFGNIVETIEPGQAATRAQAAKLDVLALQPDDWQRYLARRRPLPGVDGDLAFVRVEHDGRLASEVLENSLGVRPGDPIDAKAMASDADSLQGLQLYQRVGYRLEKEDGHDGVVYDAEAKSWGPNFLQFGIALEDDLEGSTGFNVATRLTRAGINSLGAEWRTDLTLGTDPKLFSEFYQPLGFSTKYFVAPHVELSQTNINAFDTDATVALFRVSRAEGGLDIGREIGNIGEFRTGLFRGFGNTHVKVGDPALGNADFDTGGSFATLRFDTVDNARFPTSGSRVDLRWTGSRPTLGADAKFDTLEGEFATTFTRGSNSVQVGLSYATTLDSDSAIQDFFGLGGFLRLSGLERGEISGPHAGLARLVYRRRVGETAGGIFDTPVYFGLSAEAGNAWQDRDDIRFSSLTMNGSVFVGLDTIIGAVYLAAGFAEGGQTNFSLFVGEPPR